MLRMLDQDFLTAGVWDQHLFWRSLIRRVALYCFYDLGWRKGVINLWLSESPQFTKGYFNIVMHEVSSFLWLSITAEVYFKCSHSIISFKIDWSREQNESFPYVTDGTLEDFISLFWKWKIKYKNLTFFFEN